MITSILRFFSRLIELHPTVQNSEQRRRVGVLSVLALIAVLFFIISIVINLLRQYSSPDQIISKNNLVLIDIGFGVLFGLIYGFSRSRYFQVASVLMVLTTLSASFVGIYTHASNPEFLAYLVLGVIVSGLLYSTYGILLVSLITIAGIYFVPLIIPGSMVFDIHLILGMVILVSALVLVTSYIRQKDHDQIEQQARQVSISENHFRNLLESTGEIIVILGDDGSIRFISPSVREALGYEPESLAAMNINDLIHQDDKDAMQASLTANSTGKSIELIPSIEIRIQCKNLNWKLFEIQFRGLFTSPELVGNIIICRDITQKKQAEKVQQVTYQISQMANSAVSLDELYGLIHKSLADLIEVGNFFIALYDADTNMLKFVYFIDQFDTTPEPRKPGHGLTEYILRTGKPLLAPQPVIDELTQRGEIELVGSESVDWLGVPLKVNERIIGVMVTQSYTEGIRFNERDKNLLEFVSSQIAMAIERKRSEEALRNAEAILRGTVDSTTDSVFLLDRSGLVQLINREASRKLGKNSSELQGMHYSSFLPPDVARSRKEHIDRIINTGTPETWEDDRQGIYFENNVFPIKNQDEEVIHLAIFGRDITERKKAEKALQDAEQKYRELVEQIPVVVYMYDLDDKNSTLYMSPLIESYTGFKPEQWISDSELWTKLIHPDDRERVVADNTRTNKTGEPFKAEYRLVARDGHVLWVRDEAELQRDDEGRPRFWKGVLLDITDRIQAEIKEKQRVQELETLYQTSLEINSQSTLTSLLKLIVERAASLIGVDSGGLYLLDPDGQTLTLLIGHGELEKHVLNKIKIGEGLSGRVMQTGETLTVEDYHQWQERSKVYDDTPFHRILAIPLKVKESVIGVINVSDTKHSGPFLPEEIRLVSLFADQAAISIEKAQLYERELVRTRELTTLYTSSMTLSTNITLESALKTIFEQVTQAVGVDGCTLSLWDQETEQIRTLADHRVKFLDKVDPPGTTYSLHDYPATRRVLETRQFLMQVADDPNIDQVELKLMEDQSIQMLLLLPMITRDKVLGLMELYNEEKKEHIISASEMQLALSLASQTAIFIENVRLFEDAQRRLRRTQVLREIDMAISGFIDINPVLEVVLKHVIAELAIDAAVVLLFDPTAQSLNYALGSGLKTSALKFTHLRLGEGYAGQAALQRKTVHIPNLQTRTTDFLRSPTFTQEGFIAYYAVPLIAKGQVEGVLEIFNRSPIDPNREWMDFMEILAGQVAIAVDNANLYSDLQRSNLELMLAYDATIEGWSKALDLRDKETEGHTQRVAQMTGKLAELMGFSPNEIAYFHRGALLHDIGKMSIPDSILLKPGPLTAQEWEVMRSHPAIAYQMLSPIKYLQGSLDIPYCHHEKWDGQGYPRGLKGESIPLPARIFAIVDVFDALTSDRPYRPAWKKKEAIDYIHTQTGTHFDPGVLDPFLKLLHD